MILQTQTPPTKLQEPIVQYPLLPAPDPVRWLRETTRRQVSGRYLDGYGGYCALGVLYDVVLGPPSDGEYSGILVDRGSKLLGLRGSEVDCPACGLDQSGGAELIIHLNDKDELSFAQIANVMEADRELFFETPSPSAHLD
jgi:hypothetical protein